MPDVRTALSESRARGREYRAHEQQRWRPELNEEIDILKLARTIADLEGAGDIKTHHLAEAIQYRPRRDM